MRSTPRLFLLLVVTSVALAAPAASAQFENLFGGKKEKVTVEQVAKKKGLKVEKSVTADVDGDGTTETVGACIDSDKNVRLCVFGEDDNGAVLKHLAKPAGGKRLRHVKAEDLVPEVIGTEVILEVYDETPDEKVKSVRVYAGYPEIRQIFTRRIYRSKNKAKRPKWENDDVVKYGDAFPGWYFVDNNDDGRKEILVRGRPKVIEVKRRKEGSAKILVGVQESVWDYVGEPSDGAYVEGHVVFNNFLDPAHEIEKVNSSSTYIDPAVLNEMKSEALAAAVYGGGEAPAEVKVDRTEFTARVADKSLDTGWSEDAKGSGKGEWVELVLDDTYPVHMVRITPGCVESKRSYRSYSVPEKIEIRLDGKTHYVDLRKPDRPEPPVVAISAQKLQGKPWAKRYMIFFDGEYEAERVRVTLDRAKKQGKGNHTCISEISVH
jgi:hypothetical protein